MILRSLKTFEILVFFIISIIMTNTFPVLAQSPDPPEATAAVTSTLEETLTPTPIIVPSETIQVTETAFIEMSLTPSVEVTDASTQSPEPSTATATKTPTKKISDCTTNNVFQFQIILKHEGESALEIPVEYWVVDGYIDANGDHVLVIQVREEDYCSVLTDLRNNSLVLGVEPNYEVTILETVPNDPGYTRQSYLNNIQAPSGWDYSTGSPAVTIAIIDTGVDLTHIDLAGKIIAGYDFIDNDSSPQDANGHGTMVAGVAAAMTNNGAGVAGVSWGAQIMPLRVLDAAGNGSYNNVAQAVIWATDHGARVINLSLGGSNYSSILADAINYAVAQGVVVVAATGNSGLGTVFYPAALPGVIGVGATDLSNRLASFSNTGAGVDLVAPGVSIYSTYPGNMYSDLNGTSLSAPQVSGFAAILLSMPSMQFSSDVVNLMESTALDLGASGWDSQYGYGLIQIGDALSSISQPLPTVTTVSSPTPLKTVELLEPTHTRTPSWEVYYNPSATPTTGEVFMLQTPGEGLRTTIATPSITVTEDKTSNDVLWQNSQKPGEANNFFQRGFLLCAGFLCLLISLSIYLYSRRQ
jgi:subtilisin family serine protease